MKTYLKFQIGKNGLTEGVLNSIVLASKNHKQIRISILKSFCRDRAEINNISEKIKAFILKKSNIFHNIRIIGFKIILTRSSNK